MFSVSSKLLPKIFNSIKCWVYVLHKILVLNLPWGRNYKEMMKVFGWHYCKLIWDIVRVSEINTLYLHSISWFTQKKILFHLSFMTSGDLSKILLTQLLMLNWSMLKFLSLFEPKCMERYCIKPEAVMNAPQTCWYCCSVTKLCPALFDLMDCSTPVPEFVLHYLPEFAQTHVHWVCICTSLSPRVCSNSCPLSWWYHPIISSSVAPFSCPQSFQHQGLSQ